MSGFAIDTLPSILGGGIPGGQPPGGLLGGGGGTDGGSGMQGGQPRGMDRIRLRRAFGTGSCSVLIARVRLSATVNAAE